MNIFFLHRDPITCAKHHCDKHCVKMILETAQMLSTCLHIVGTKDHISFPLYKPTHINHGCNVWLRQGLDNYNWLCEMGLALAREKEQRFGKPHKSASVIANCASVTPCVPLGWTEPCQAMPEHYRRSESPVEAYRAYYRDDKAYFAKWRNGEPDWWVENEFVA